MTYLEDKGRCQKGMKIAFLVLVLFFSLRYNYGNDFGNYLSKFQEISKIHSIKEIFDFPELEPGWVLFNIAFKSLGFQWLIFVHTLVSQLIVYILIRKYVPKGWWWLSVMFYLLNTNLFMTNLSMLRQGLASLIMVFAFFKLYEKKYLFFLLLCFVSFEFHKTCLLLLPFYLLIPLSRLLKPKIILFIVLIGLIILYYVPSQSFVIFDMIMGLDLMPETYTQYAISMDGYQAGSGIGVMIYALCAIMSIYAFNYKFQLDKVLSLIYISSLIFIPLSYVMVMLLRLSYYFLIFGMFLFPRLYSMYCIEYKHIFVKNEKYNRFLAINKISIVLNIVYLVYSYFAFFQAPTYAPYYGTYHFCFE